MDWNSWERDWRNRGQDDYLRGATLVHKQYQSNFPKNLPPGDDPRNYSDHEHCEFCFAKFSEHSGDLHSGFCTENQNYWICEECFNDLSSMFQWKVIE